MRNAAIGALLLLAVLQIDRDTPARSSPAGANNTLTAVPGIKVGHHTLTERPTGCTVILVDGEGAVGGVSQRGGAPGTRETDLLDPSNMVDKVNAIVLAGGSAFGLEAATGTVRWLEEHNIGWPAGVSKVPIVPAAILFDLGFDAVQVDACIRVGDERVVADLRALAGHSVFEPKNPAMGIILMASPHRVFVSRLGRIEVFAKIPPPDGKSPEGPHTHVLPKLLRTKRTHSATEPVPDGYLPCAHLYPAHPVKDSLGHELAYDARRHENFQDILRRFGDPNAVALKQRVKSTIQQGSDPAQLRVPSDRFARAGIRVALRQMQAANDAPPALNAWIEHYDRMQSANSDIDDEIHTEVSHAPS